jgi:hypothetical protein
VLVESVATLLAQPAICTYSSRSSRRFIRSHAPAGP